MLCGLGCDVIEIDRIKKALERNELRFVDSVLTKEEKEVFELRKQSSELRAARYLAGRWAAKEAFSKAMGTGFRGAVKFGDISVLNDELGAPYIKLSGELAKTVEDNKLKFFVSLSDSELVTMAVVAAERIE